MRLCTSLCKHCCDYSCYSKLSYQTALYLSSSVPKTPPQASHLPLSQSDAHHADSRTWGQRSTHACWKCVAVDSWRHSSPINKSLASRRDTDGGEDRVGREYCLSTGVLFVGEDLDADVGSGGQGGLVELVEGAEGQILRLQVLHPFLLRL